MAAPRAATVLYVTGEESAAQVRLRADRIGALADRALPRGRDRPVGACWGTSTRSQPELLVVDSIQTIGSAEVDGAPGGVTQVREVAGHLIRVAKERGIATVARRPRHQGRLDRRPAACWSTSSTSSSTSRATGTAGCAWSAR